MAIQTGLRVTELASLRCQDVHRGGALSREAIALLVTKRATTASRRCSTLTSKTVAPHTLWHTTR